MRSTCLLFVTCLLTGYSFGQTFGISGTISAAAFVSGEEQNPFWFYANSANAIHPNSDYNFLGGVQGQYNWENTTIEAGTSFFYRNGTTDEFQRNALYVQFKSNWLKATLGAKGIDEQLSGLSTTNKNFIWSGNARPLPGLRLEANNPIRISDMFAIDWGIAHYSLNDSRYVDDPRVHYKRLGVITTFNDNSKLTVQLQHTAQWGGTSPDIGELPSDFEAFVDVFFASKAPEIGNEGEVINAIGNHIGSLLIDYSFGTSVGEFSAYHEHPFEDGSGTRFDNFPDGVWGLFFQPENSKIISAALLEIVITSNQSGPGPASGRDNYFSNNVYRSGWSYERTIIGFPFIEYDKTLELTSTNNPLLSTRVRVFHLGLTGSVKDINWKFKTSYSESLGTYLNPFPFAVNRWANYVAASYDFGNYGVITLIAGLDTSNVTETNFGAGIVYRYSFGN